MESTFPELTALGVQWQGAAGADGRTAFHPVAEFADPAETHGLYPGQRDVGEPVVELDDVDVDVRGGHRCALPHRLRALPCSAEQKVVGIGPVRLPARAHRDGVYPDRRLRCVRRPRPGGDDDRTGTRHRIVTVQEPQRIRDHPGVQVVVHRHQVTQGRALVEA